MKSIKINALAYIGIRILNTIFPLLTGTYVARVLDKSYYGYFNSVDTILSFFLPFATYGVYSYGLRAISNVKNNKDKVNKAFSQLFYLCIGCTILTTLVYLVAYPLFFENNPILKKVYLVMSIQLIAQIFSIEWVNEALENYDFLFYKTAFIRVLMLASIFIFIKNEKDIIPYTLIMSLATLINYVISYFWIKKDIKLVKVSLKEFKPLFIPLTAMLIFSSANMLFTFLDRLFLVKAGEELYVTYYTMAQRIVGVVTGVVTGAVSVSLPRLNYYLGIGDKDAYTSLVNRGSRIFMFLIIPISLGLTVLGTETILLYGSEKYVGGGILTSLFAFRFIFLALDIILGSQIIFANGFEKKLTLFTVLSGLLNIILNSALFFNKVAAPEFYLLTTMLSEAILLITYVIFIKKKQLISLKYIFSYTLKYFMISLTFIPIYFIINYIHPTEMKITLDLIINISAVIFLSVISYCAFLTATKDEIFYEFLGYVKKLKDKFSRI